MLRAELDEGKFLNGDEDDEENAADGAMEDDEIDAGRNLQTIPASLDWRTKGVLNPIRYQGTCGGCYTFSTVMSMEAVFKIKKGVLPSLSE